MPEHLAPEGHNELGISPDVLLLAIHLQHWVQALFVNIGTKQGTVW